MKKDIENGLAIILLIVIISFGSYYGFLGWTFSSGKKSVEYQPEISVLENSIYMDEGQSVFIGWNNAIIVVDGDEVFVQWAYIHSGFWFDQLEPQYDEDGKMSVCFYVEKPISGKFRYTKNDRLILKISLFYSQLFRGKRFVLQRYDMDAIDWDALPLSEEAVSWLVDDIEVEIKPQQ